MSFDMKNIHLPNGVVMPFMEQGAAAGLPVVFLHGLSDSHRSFGPLFVNLPPHVRAFALTQRGHGDASRPREGYRPEDMADDVAAFLDAMGIEAAVIAGHSMGSLVARAFAHAYPRRTLGLVLIGAFASLHNNHDVEVLRAVIDSFNDPVPEDFVREFQVSTIAQPVTAAFLDMVVAESLKLPAFVWQGAIGGLMERDRTFTASGLSVPTLILWGDRDVFCSRQDQDTLVAALAKSTLVTYPGVGHSPHWEKPMQVAVDLGTWLARIERPHVKRAA
jgi:non-heme chloroperoxidase